MWLIVITCVLCAICIHICPHTSSMPKCWFRHIHPTDHRNKSFLGAKMLWWCLLWHSMVVSPWVSPWLSPVRLPAQQFLDGEKLVDGMLRRVRSAAMQAGRDPNERRGSTVELAFPSADGQVTYGYLWDRMENGWMMDASNLSYLSINSYCQVIILIIPYLFLDLLITRPRSISSQRQHQVPIASHGSITHRQAHAAHRREPQIHAARGVCSHFSGIYIYISYIYIYISYLIVIIYIYHIW